jgi:hypothetical protein
MITHLNRWLLTLLVALAAIGTSFDSASAAPATPPSGSTKAELALARTYKAEQKRLQIQDGRLTRAVTHAAKIDSLIAKLKAKGKDTTALEAAVAEFRSGIGQARAEWQAASATLTTHAGFDGDGKVSNADQARTTLKEAHGHMEQAHTIAQAAYQKLRAAIAAYRKANRGVAEPVEPQQP